MLKLTPLFATLLLLTACEPTAPPATRTPPAPVAPSAPAAPQPTAPAVPAASTPATAPATPVAAAPKVMHWDAAPAMAIDAAKTYTATFTLKKGGKFTVNLYAKEAPITVNSFVFLARQGYFDGLSFHRVLEGFMAQGGDPTGTGMGNPGYQFKNEDSDLRFDRAGVLAMANAGRDTNGSQFFITFGPTPQLDGDYTIFGQVTDGMEVVNHITRRDPRPGVPVGDLIETIKIEEK